jgi:hypothetical protein
MSAHDYSLGNGNGRGGLGRCAHCFSNPGKDHIHDRHERDGLKTREYGHRQLISAESSEGVLVDTLLLPTSCASHRLCKRPAFY